MAPFLTAKTLFLAAALAPFLAAISRSVGTGKDHLMMGISKILYYHHKSVMWTNGSRLKARMRLCISNKDAESEREIVEELSKPDFLWLSDPIIAGEPLTAYQRDFMYAIIDRRYQAQKPTLLTINVESASQLDEVLGAATADRLRENSYSHFCDWKTHRKTKSIDSLPLSPSERTETLCFGGIAKSI